MRSIQEEILHLRKEYIAHPEKRGQIAKRGIFLRTVLKYHPEWDLPTLRLEVSQANFESSLVKGLF